MISKLTTKFTPFRTTASAKKQKNEDSDRVIETEKNKRAYKKAIIDYDKGDIVTTPDVISSFEEFRSFVRAHAN